MTIAFGGSPIGRTSATTMSGSNRKQDAEDDHESAAE